MGVAAGLGCGEMDLGKAPFHLQMGPALGTAGEADKGGVWVWVGVQRHG